jgi:hypothetical protein
MPPQGFPEFNQRLFELNQRLSELNPRLFDLNHRLSDLHYLREEAGDESDCLEDEAADDDEEEHVCFRITSAFC